MPQPQCSLRAFQSAVLSHPPCNQLKHGGQKDVDCVSLSASLALVPGVLNPQQVLLQRAGLFSLAVPAGGVPSNSPQLSVYVGRVVPISLDEIGGPNRAPRNSGRTQARPSGSLSRD
jgi:hypothetical protein